MSFVSQRLAAAAAPLTFTRNASHLAPGPPHAERTRGDGSLDAARGMVFGVVGGGLCWLAVAALVYLAIR